MNTMNNFYGGELIEQPNNQPEQMSIGLEQPQQIIPLKIFDVVLSCNIEGGAYQTRPFKTSGIIQARDVAEARAKGLDILRQSIAREDGKISNEFAKVLPTKYAFVL